MAQELIDSPPLAAPPRGIFHRGRCPANRCDEQCASPPRQLGIWTSRARRREHRRRV